MATICLDPGHGGADAGAVRQGLLEKTLTLEIARVTEEALRGDHRVVLTRDADVSVPLADRRRIAEEARADLFLSVHVNAADHPGASGFEAFVRRLVDRESTALAAAILDQLAGEWPDRPNRGLRSAPLAVLQQARPCCLVECLFLSNPEEWTLLAQPGTRLTLGRALARGCAAYLRGADLTAGPPVLAAGGKGRTAPRRAPSPRPRGSRPV